MASSRRARVVPRALRRLASRSERGAVLVEFAFVVPVFITLVFGMIEYGLIFRDYLTVANVTRTGARVASAGGADVTTDYQILQSVKAAAAALPNGANSLQGIIVYRGSASTGALPTGCAIGGPSVGGQCNVYQASDANLPSSSFCGVSPCKDSAWAPSTRVDRQSGPPDYVGVYVSVDHKNVTGLFGSGRTIKDGVVMRIEPRRS